MNIIKKAAIALAVLAAAPSLQAQSQLLKTVNLDFLSDALSPAVRVVRSTYLVANSDLSQKYAAKNDTVFGRDYSMAFIVPGGIVIPEAALMPWAGDPKFNTYRENPAYQPYLHDRTMALLAPDALYQPLDIESTLGEEVPAGNSSSPLRLVSTGSIEGAPALETMVPTETTRGFAVWYILLPDTDIDSTTSLNIKIESVNVDFNADGTPATITPAYTRGDILGGLFVAPVIESPGLVRFKVAGFLAPGSRLDEKWQVLPAILPEPIELEPVTPVNEPTDGESVQELSPVGEDI